jgi:hypothetical protein
MFVGMVFERHGIDVVVGRGDAFDFRQFAGGDLPQDTDRLFAVMRKRFPTSRLQLSRAPAEMWLGRSFPPAAG